MVVISRKSIREFGKKYSDARDALAAWFTTTQQADWKNTAEVRNTFKDLDFVGERVVFNIAWNRYRLIAFIAYKVRTVYIKEVLTHKEYSKEYGSKKK